MAVEWKLPGWLTTVFRRKAPDPPPAAQPQKPRLPRYMPTEIISLAVKDMKNDPRTHPYDHIATEYLDALIVENDAHLAVEAQWKRRESTELFGQIEACESAYSSYIAMAIKHGHIDEVPHLFPISAWVTGSLDTPPELPAIRYAGGFNGVLEMAIWRMRFDHRNLPYLYDAKYCTEALYVSLDAETAMYVGKKLPLEVLLRLDTALRFTWLTSVTPEQQEKLEAKARLRQDDVSASKTSLKKKPIKKAPKPRQRSPTSAERERAMQMKREGKNNAEIAREVGFSRSTISRLK